MPASADFYTGWAVVPSIGTYAFKCEPVEMKERGGAQFKWSSALNMMFDHLNDFIYLPKAVSAFGSRNRVRIGYQRSVKRPAVSDKGVSFVMLRHLLCCTTAGCGFLTRKLFSFPINDLSCYA